MTATPLAPFDPHDPRLRDQPYALFDRYRAEDPVHWSETAGSIVLTRHRDISTVLRMPGLEPASVLAFSEAVGRRLGRTWPALQAFIDAILFLDATAGHRQARRMLAATLNHRPLAEFSPMIAGLTDELLTPLLDEPAFDLVARFTDPLPYQVMCRILGLPRDVGDRIFAISRNVLRLFNFVLGVREMDAFDAWLTEAFGLIQGLIEERRRQPQSDGITRLLDLAKGEDAHDDIWIQSRVLFLLLVGAETTSAFLSSAIRLSLDMPEIRPAAAEPQQAARVVEELLRLDSPVMLAVRRTTADIELAGRPVAAGTAFIPYITAGNRDPEAYPEPDRFLPGRPGPGNLAFGEGAHACLGGALARLEGRIALPAFFSRLPELRRAEPEVADNWLHLDTFRRLGRLPLARA
ncbi:hypothetical protein EDC65_5186 [Stella humosa]|uniref:Cytochrome P450 n=1 Tax=Stella humosa TaxID=94 RepID=A0A3N1KRA2_9PROT|nr:cytochrome P450 [Stella humosa]ROP81329.1 hypothetical protein EDC65_5186 [Stella humosa]BBK32679.1 hypothetical protein STHU_33130 [Stella humosa]